MQHNIKKIKEILVPYTAEENAELSGGEDTVPPPLPPRRPPPRAASAEAPDAPDAPPLPQRTPQTEAEGRAAMKAYKEAWEKANAEAANRPITSDNPAGDQEYPVLLTLASVSWPAAVQTSGRKAAVCNSLICLTALTNHIKPVHSSRPKRLPGLPLGIRAS